MIHGCIHGCMKSIPAATPITLTKEEHAELEGLARSTKTEHRLRQRARIVLLSAAGLATRAIGREVGCTTGTASKWRGRHAERRPAGVGGPASTHPAIEAMSPNIRTRPTSASWLYSPGPFPRAYARWNGPPKPSA